jgi:hypothetical protein
MAVFMQDQRDQADPNGTNGRLPLVTIDRKSEGCCLWLRLEQSARCNIDVIRGV